MKSGLFLSIYTWQNTAHKGFSWELVGLQMMSYDNSQMHLFPYSRWITGKSKYFFEGQLWCQCKQFTDQIQNPHILRLVCHLWQVHTHLHTDGFSATAPTIVNTQSHMSEDTCMCTHMHLTLLGSHGWASDWLGETRGLVYRVTSGRTGETRQNQQEAFSQPVWLSKGTRHQRPSHSSSSAPCNQ